MRFGDKILVTHVGIGHTQACFTHHFVDDQRIGCVNSRSEKAVDVILDNEQRTGHAVKIGQIKTGIDSRSPVAIGGISVVGERDATVRTLSELILYVAPFRELRLNRSRTVQFNREVFLRTCLFRRDKNHAVRGPTSV